MRAFLFAVFSDFVATIVTLGLSAIVGFLAWLQDIPWYQLALGVIFAFGGSLFLINQFRTWWPTRRIKDDRWLSDAIARWLLSAKFSVTKVTTEDTIFHYHTEMHGRKFSIMKTKDNPDDLKFSFILSIKENEQSFIDKLDNDTASKLMEDMRIEMSRLGVLYSNLKLPLRDIYIENYLPIDFRLERFKLIQCALLMIRANVLIHQLYIRALRLAKMPLKPDSSKEDS